MTLLGAEFMITEYLLAQGQESRHTNRSVRLLAAQAFAARTAARQRATSRNEELNVMVGEAGAAQCRDGTDCQAVFDHLQEVQFRTQSPIVQDLSQTFEKDRPFVRRDTECSCVRHDTP